MACLPPWEPDMSCSPDWDTLDPAIQERSTALAWSSIRTLTGGRVGSCESVLRPCVQNVCDPCLSWWSHGHEHLSPYGVFLGPHGPCGGHNCSCQPISEILLPGQGVVLDVFEDGAALDPDAYRLDDHRRLIRTDGGQWMSCQALDRPETETGTFAVHYVPGADPGPDGLWAVGVLAWEFSKACGADGKCRLPSSVTTVVRQGVTMTLDNTSFQNGLTGIREVDSYIYSLNPNRLANPPRVWSPDSRPDRFETTGAF